VSSDWYEPGGNPEEELLNPAPPPKEGRPLPVWMKSAWFRGLLFVLLLAPVVALALGTPAIWVSLFLAVIGLGTVLFGDEIYGATSIFRELQYKDGEYLERTNLARGCGMVSGGFVWILALIFALIGRGSS
jgi:hypothetical protein